MLRLSVFAGARVYPLLGRAFVRFHSTHDSSALPMRHENETRISLPVEAKLVSIIIPTFNGGSRIGRCLNALLNQTGPRDFEILVINDGSTDNTAEVVAGYPGIKLISQSNAGPAAARNRGAQHACGTIILFTDDDCVPEPGWLEAMLEPFANPEVAGVKGVYRTKQKEVLARFVQVEYEDRYRLMSRHLWIDFVDAYSAGFRRNCFLEMGGYDTSFPVACAEDVELSYRMSSCGWKMKFVPKAVVSHTHPHTLWRYLKKKYKFAFWRVHALRKNPGKVVKDSHTPQIMKIQLLFPVALLLAFGFDLAVRPKVPASMLVSVAFLVTAFPFIVRAIRRDSLVGILSPFLLAGRACAQMLGVAAGFLYSLRHTNRLAAKATA
jgi:glycosyltransferase involved in cell wall biosynthesis